MRIVGEWFLCDDGITRPVVRAQVRGAERQPHDERFLIDSGADRTVLSATLLGRLRLPTDQPAANLALMGIAGTTPFVLVTAAVEFPRGDGQPVRVSGQYAAFTDPRATDLSVLGRDVLGNFDMILGRGQGEVLLLAPPHQYVVSRA